MKLPSERLKNAQLNRCTTSRAQGYSFTNILFSVDSRYILVPVLLVLG